MESGEESSSANHSSSSELKQEDGEEDGEEGMVILPPHFPQKRKSESDFSPPSESSEEEEEEDGSSSTSGSVPAPPPHYQAPPTSRRAHLLEDSDNGSVMESMTSERHAGNYHISVPYSLTPPRRRLAASVNYSQFYEAGSESGSDSEDVGVARWKRNREKSDSEFEVSDMEGEAEESVSGSSILDEGSSDWEDQGGGKGRKRGGWVSVCFMW